MHHALYQAFGHTGTEKKSIQRASKYTITNEKEFREQILAELAARQEAMVEELAPDEEEQTPKSAMDFFIALAKKYADFEELTPTMIHEFIDRVVVHESNGVRGFGRTQKIEIYFTFIGQFIPPYSTAELKAEAKEQAVKKAEKDRIRAEKKGRNRETVQGK